MASQKSKKRLKIVHDRWLALHDEGRLVKAFPLLLEAAQLGDEEAQVELGYDYAYGISGSVGKDEALHWWKRAYRQGSWAAAFNLGMFFRDEKQWNKAVKWFARAVSAGDDDGLVEIAKIHLRYGGDRPEGLRYMKLATAARARLTAPTLMELDRLLTDITKLTPGDLLFMEAELLDDRKKYKEALSLLQKGAKLNDESCQILLGNYLTRGMKGVSKNLSQGIYWYEQAFKKGSATAATNLAITYLQEKEIDKAFEWYEHAIALADGSAHLGIARLWLRHRKDAVKAHEHLNAMFVGPRNYSDADRDDARTILRRLALTTQKTK